MRSPLTSTPPANARLSVDLVAALLNHDSDFSNRLFTVKNLMYVDYLQSSVLYSPDVSHKERIKTN